MSTSLPKNHKDDMSFPDSIGITLPSPHKVQTRFHSAKPYPLTVYFDGECPVCRREINLMKFLNRSQRLRFIDFSTSLYSPTDHRLNRCDLGEVIHARWSDGTIITGVEVFSEMWEAIGFGFLARLSRRPLINALLVKGYAWFAKNRLRLTGRA